MSRGCKADTNRQKSGTADPANARPLILSEESRLIPMEQREWHELGRALREVRTSRDLGQKEVINRSGEEMGERTLRAYESGQQRPSRERLLRLLTRSFELRSVGEISRYLQIAGYAVLT